MSREIFAGVSDEGGKKVKPMIAVGYEVAKRKDWVEYVPEVGAPANYKDPIKIEEAKLKAREKQAEGAAEGVLTGRISKIAVLQISADGKGSPLQIGTVLNLIPRRKANTLLVIPNSSLLYRLAAVESLLTGEEDPIRFIEPYEDGVDGAGNVDETAEFVDPFYIFGSAANAVEGAALVLKRLKLTNPHPLGTAEWWALAGAALAHKIGFDKDKPAATSAHA